MVEQVERKYCTVLFIVTYAARCIRQQTSFKDELSLVTSLVTENNNRVGPRPAKIAL